MNSHCPSCGSPDKSIKCPVLTYYGTTQICSDRWHQLIGCPTCYSDAPNIRKMVWSNGYAQTCIDNWHWTSNVSYPQRGPNYPNEIDLTVEDIKFLARMDYAFSQPLKRFPL